MADAEGAQAVDDMTEREVEQMEAGEEFELAEVMMEHYILKGRGRHVYDEYADPYREMVGNWRQL